MRLFLSIPLSPAVMDALSVVQQQLVAAVGEEHLKLVKPTDFYCTLLSLGDRDASQWEGVVDASVVVSAAGQPLVLPGSIDPDHLGVSATDEQHQGGPWRKRIPQMHRAEVPL